MMKTPPEFQKAIAEDPVASLFPTLMLAYHDFSDTGQDFLTTFLSASIPVVKGALYRKAPLSRGVLHKKNPVAFLGLSPETAENRLAALEMVSQVFERRPSDIKRNRAKLKRARRDFVDELRPALGLWQQLVCTVLGVLDCTAGSLCREDVTALTDDLLAHGRITPQEHNAMAFVLRDVDLDELQFEIAESYSEHVRRCASPDLRDALNAELDQALAGLPKSAHFVFTAFCRVVVSAIRQVHAMPEEGVPMTWFSNVFNAPGWSELKEEAIADALIALTVMFDRFGCPPLHEYPVISPVFGQSGELAFRDTANAGAKALSAVLAGQPDGILARMVRLLNSAVAAVMSGDPEEAMRFMKHEGVVKPVIGCFAVFAELGLFKEKCCFEPSQGTPPVFTAEQILHSLDRSPVSLGGNFYKAALVFCTDIVTDLTLSDPKRLRACLKNALRGTVPPPAGRSGNWAVLNDLTDQFREVKAAVAKISLAPGDYIPDYSSERYWFWLIRCAMPRCEAAAYNGHWVPADAALVRLMYMIRLLTQKDQGIAFRKAAMQLELPYMPDKDDCEDFFDQCVRVTSADFVIGAALPPLLKLGEPEVAEHMRSVFRFACDVLMPMIQNDLADDLTVRTYKQLVTLSSALGEAEENTSFATFDVRADFAVVYLALLHKRASQLYPGPEAALAVSEMTALIAALSEKVDDFAEELRLDFNYSRGQTPRTEADLCLNTIVTLGDFYLAMFVGHEEYEDGDDDEPVYAGQRLN